MAPGDAVDATVEDSLCLFWRIKQLISVENSPRGICTLVETTWILHGSYIKVDFDEDEIEHLL